MASSTGSDTPSQARVDMTKTVIVCVTRQEKRMRFLWRGGAKRPNSAISVPRAAKPIR